MHEFPPNAYAPGGSTLWWELEHWPGMKRRFGAERKLAAWLMFNLEIGEIFTMRHLRAELGDGVIPNDDEHLNRRLRQLRKNGWDVPTQKDDGSLSVGEYRLTAVGWSPSDGRRPATNQVSQAVRRIVFERDARRCVVCNVGKGEPYPGEPGTRAVITIGHRFPDARNGSADADNLQTECQRCNEPIREVLPNPETLDELLPSILKLPKKDAQTLFTWLSNGYRRRDSIDQLFDRARKLSRTEHASLIEKLKAKIRD